MAIVQEIEEEASYIYHVQEFKENSLILNVMTVNYGPVAVMARGALHEKSPLKAMLQLYTPLKLSMKAGKGDLYYLTDCELCGESYFFEVPLLFCASYMNELLYYLYKQKEADHLLFASYVGVLEALKAKKNIDLALRCFELRLLSSLGYGLSLRDWEGRLLKKKQLYRFSFGGGFVAVDTQSRPVNPLAKSDRIGRSSASYGSDDGLLFSKSKVRGPRFGDTKPSFDFAQEFADWSPDSLQELYEYVKNFIGPVMRGETIAEIVHQKFTQESLLQAKQLSNAILAQVLGGREIKSRQLYRDYLQLQKGTKKQETEPSSEAEAEEVKEGKNAAPASDVAKESETASTEA